MMEQYRFNGFRLLYKVDNLGSSFWPKDLWAT